MTDQLTAPERALIQWLADEVGLNKEREAELARRLAGMRAAPNSRLLAAALKAVGVSYRASRRGWASMADLSKWLKQMHNNHYDTTPWGEAVEEIVEMLVAREGADSAAVATDLREEREGDEARADYENAARHREMWRAAFSRKGEPDAEAIERTRAALAATEGEQGGSKR